MIKEKQNEISQLKLELAKLHKGTAYYLAIESRILLLQNDINAYEKKRNKARLGK